MTKEQKEEFLQFLDKECSPNEALNKCTFRLLCFTDNKHKLRKEYIQYEQINDNAVWESHLLIPSVNIRIQFNKTVQELIDLVKNV